MSALGSVPLEKPYTQEYPPGVALCQPGGGAMPSFRLLTGVLLGLGVQGGGSGVLQPHLQVLEFLQWCPIYG